MGPHVEVIRIRSGNHQTAELEVQINEILQEALGDFSIDMIRFYANQSIPGDYMVCLFWDSPIPEKQGSALGRKLKGSLEGLGLVNHSTWLEDDLLPA